MQTIRKIKIEGFKSIASAELELGDLNVVIGANGAGKSNLIGAFGLFERICAKRLQLSVASQPDRLLHHGRKVTPTLSMAFEYGFNSYSFTLKAKQDTLVFERERATAGGEFAKDEPNSAGYLESKIDRSYLMLQKGETSDFRFIESDLAVYHFHDTSDSSPAKQTCDIDDNRFLRRDASNLPAYLYWLQQKHPVNFRRIEEHIRLVAPFFDKFVLVPLRLNEQRIKLEWQHKQSDAYFDAYSLSDGTLRFICLATLLLQPKPPAFILLDEPELGLHPFALHILAEMLEAAAIPSQILLATQSVTLLDCFSPKDIIVAENDGRQSTFKRLNEDRLHKWLNQYSIGELWEKSVFGGQP